MRIGLFWFVAEKAIDRILYLLDWEVLRISNLLAVAESGGVSFTATLPRLLRSKLDAAQIG
jgi:hypothetical protein